MTTLLKTTVCAIGLGLLMSGPAVADTKTILGIFFTGCDELCQGVQAGLADSGFDVELLVRDMRQDKATIPGFIEEARTLGVDLVLTHGTSATLGTIGRIEDVGNPDFVSDMPVVFTQVADPFGTGIAAGFDGSGRDNVAGTFNRVPETINVEVIRQYDPEFDTLGLLYNGNEENSRIKHEELAALAPTLGIDLIALEIDPGNPGSPDADLIPVRMKELADRGVDWVYLGSSSFLRTNGDVFTGSAVENGIAVVSPYEYLVREHQALLSVAAREEDVGRLAAEQALRILRDGAVPGELPIVRAMDFAYVVNLSVGQKLGRIPPFAFLQVAETVHN